MISQPIGSHSGIILFLIPVLFIFACCVVAPLTPLNLRPKFLKTGIGSINGINLENYLRKYLIDILLSSTQGAVDPSH